MPQLAHAACAVEQGLDLDHDALCGRCQEPSCQVVVAGSHHWLGLVAGHGAGHAGEEVAQGHDVGVAGLAAALVHGLDGYAIGVVVEEYAPRAVVAHLKVAVVVVVVGYLGSVFLEPGVKAGRELIELVVDVEAVVELLGVHVVAGLGGEVAGQLDVAVAISLLVGVILGEESMWDCFVIS